MGTNGTAPLATVVVSPRERDSGAVRSLDSVLRSTPRTTPIVYVAGAPPPAVARRLRKRLSRRPATWIAGGGVVPPNVARNLALPHVTTRYVAFVDNDIRVAPGWLEALVACAEETGADVVGPLCLSGPWRRAVVHVAGGDARLLEGAAGRRLVERQEGLGESPAAFRVSAVREETELAEFHTMLVRRSVFERLGPLDEEVRSLGEHVDFCVRVRRARGTVWFEPASVVTYVPPARVSAADVPTWARRWSEAWNEASERRLVAYWGLDPADPFLRHERDFGAEHRRHWLRGLSLDRVLPRGPRRRLRRALDTVLSPLLARRTREVAPRGRGGDAAATRTRP